MALLLLCTSQTPDTTVVHRLLHEARALLDSAHYDTALQRAYDALGLAQEGSILSGECLLLMGNIFLESGDWVGAEQQYRNALLCFQEKNVEQPALISFAFNGLGEVYYKRNDYTQSEAFYQKALLLRQSLYGERHESVAASFNNLGNCAFAKGRYAESLALHSKSLRIRQQVLPADHPDLATSHNNLGNCFSASDDPARALSEFEVARYIRQKAFGENHPKTAQILNNMGNCYAALGRRDQALRCYQHALHIRKQLLGERHPDLIPSFENLGDLCFDGGDYIAALDYYRRSLFVMESGTLNTNNPSSASLLHKLAQCYQYEGDYQRALELHTKAATGLVQAFGKKHPIVAGLWNNIGNCYAAQHAFGQAATYYRLAEHIYLSERDEDRNSNLALVYNNLGLCFAGRSALVFFQKSEKLLPPYPTPVLASCLKNQALAFADLHQWPTAQTLFARALKCAQATDPTAQIEVLSAQGILLCQYGRQRTDEGLLQQSLAMLTRALRLSDSLRLGLSATASRQRWTEQQYPALQAAVEAAFHLWKITGQETFLEQAFGLSERSRSLQLIDHLRHEQAEHFAGISDSLLEKEHYWREVLNRREKQRWAETALKHSDTIQGVAPDIAEARQQLANIGQQMETISPAYYRLKYAVSTASSKTVRQEILKGREGALVEYFRTDSAWFVFVMTATDFKAIRVAADPILDKQVLQFRSCLEKWPNASGEETNRLAAQYAELAYNLFQKIFAPVQAAVTLPKHLVIVPDGTLTYLPFEALLYELPADCQRFKTHPYLLRDFQISYAYSSTQLMELLAAPHQAASKNMLAMAPSFDNTPFQLKPLQHNQPEAKAVSDLLGGDLKVGDQATLAAFLQAAGDYRILHLATHGQARHTVGDLSYLAFSLPKDSTEESFLYVRDLYLQHLPADLVVLSACQTNAGEYLRGEGVVSIAKGFFQAGARSVVATLWSVDDAKNADLMLRFFQNLQQGDEKDAALRNAKLAFLDAHPHDEAHPVFWAAALAQGEMDVIKWKTLKEWWWMAGILLGGWLLFFFFQKRYKIF